MLSIFFIWYFKPVFLNFRLLVTQEKLLCKLNLKLWRKETWLAIFEDFIWNKWIFAHSASFAKLNGYSNLDSHSNIFLWQEMTKKWFISLGRCQCNRNLTFSTEWLALLQHWTRAKVNWNFRFKDSFGKFPKCAA